MGIGLGLGPGNTVLPFFFLIFFFTPKFAYVVTICNFEFCSKRRAIRHFHAYNMGIHMITVYNACSRCHSYLDVSLFFRNLLTFMRDWRRRKDCCILLNMVKQRRKKGRGGMMHDSHQTYTKNYRCSFASIHCNFLPHQSFQYSLLASFPGLPLSPSVFAYCKRSKTGRWEGLETRLIHRNI